MQQYTVYLYLSTALHVSGCICTHHQELMSLYLQSGINETITAICRERDWIRIGHSNGLVRARYCRYSDMSS